MMIDDERRAPRAGRVEPASRGHGIDGESARARTGELRSASSRSTIDRHVVYNG